MKVKLFIVALLVLVVLSPKILSHSFFKESSESFSGNIDHYAVIVTVGEPTRDKKNTEDLFIVLVENGWSEDKIYLLEEKDATKDAILEIPDYLNCQGLDENDVVLFYFSMHGIRKKDVTPFDESDGMDECLMAYKKDDDSDNIIFDDEIASAFENIRSENIVMIFETCYSGGMIDGVSDLKKSGRVILTSSDADESSYPIFLLKSWLFPYYVLKGLKGRADLNSDNFISAEEIFNYAKICTIRRSTVYAFLLFIFHGSLLIQHPQMYDGWPTEENNKEDFILVALD